MAEPLTMVSERVDDGPVLLDPLDGLGVHPLLDAHVPIHGHGVGWSLGWVSVLGVVQFLSAGDQRLNPVAPWATQRLHTRREGTGPRVHPLDSSDDRWAPGLEAVRDEPRGRAVAGALSPSIRGGVPTLTHHPKHERTVSRIVQHNALKPAVVPTNRGGIQIEWHTQGVDLEMEMIPHGGIRLLYDNPQEDAEEEFELGLDFTPLADLIAKVSPSR